MASRATQLARTGLAGFGLVALVAQVCGAPVADDASQIDPQATYDAAKDLFDQFAPTEVKEQYEFPSFEEFKTFAAKLQAALDSGSLEQLAAYEPQAKAALVYLRQSPENADYADWLAGRIDEMDAARNIVASEKAAPARPAPPPVHRPASPTPPLSPRAQIPYYGFWLQRLKGRPAPANAPEMMPVLRRAFAAEGVPPDLAWLAEVESSLNPRANNPSGARGLFQLKPDTAKGLGLSTFLPDQRTDPEKSAHAAAHYLSELHQRFGSWPLAIAAYNAGEGRVGRLLAANKATDFAGIASSLPSGTRMYVPEVCALVAVRSGHPVTG
jgi:membrane-bound lytic murein transglycosylase D